MPIEGYEGYYEVSSYGRARGLDRFIIHSGRQIKIKGKILSLTPHSGGYLVFRMSKDGRADWQKIHIAVAKTFLGDKSDGKKIVVCHEDGNTKNNHVDNLRWDTASNNAKDKRRHGTDKELNKTHCPKGAPLEKDNLRPDQLKIGKRACLSCSRTRTWLKINVGDFQTIHDLCFEYKTTPGKLRKLGLL